MGARPESTQKAMWTEKEGRSLGVSARQALVVLGVAALLTLSIGGLGWQVLQRVRHCLEAELLEQGMAWRAWLLDEGYRLRDEALLLASNEEVFAWLNAGETLRVRRLLALHQRAHRASEVYLLTASGAIHASSDPPLDPQAVRELPLVRLGFRGQALAELTSLNGQIWLVAVAPHVDVQGNRDAVVVVMRQVDAVFLQPVAGELDTVVLLTDGEAEVRSREGDLPPGVLAALRSGLGHGEGSALQPFGVRQGGATYEVVIVPLGVTHSGTYALGLVKRALVLDLTRRQVWLGVGLWLLLLWGAALGIVGFHAREVWRPLRRLAQAAERIAAGQWPGALEPQGAPEVRALARSLEAMRQQVAELLARERDLRQALARRVEEQSDALEEMCRVREQLLARLISAQEEERRRLSRELHDETSQELANLIVRIGTLARLTDDPQILAQLQTLREHTVRTLEGVNRMVMDLRPGLLDEYGLVPAVQWYAESRLKPLGVAVKVQGQGTPRPLPPHAQVSVYRVLQEALNNIAQHAQARQATVSFHWEEEGLRVEVADDGRGFEVASVVPGAAGHFGLLGMQERVALLGGRFRVHSAPGQGTRVVLEIPYAPPPRMEAYEAH